MGCTQIKLVLALPEWRNPKFFLSALPTQHCMTCTRSYSCGNHQLMTKQKTLPPSWGSTWKMLLCEHGQAKIPITCGMIHHSCFPLVPIGFYLFSSIYSQYSLHIYLDLCSLLLHLQLVFSVVSLDRKTEQIPELQALGDTRPLSGLGFSWEPRLKTALWDTFSWAKYSQYQIGGSGGWSLRRGLAWGELHHHLFS